MRTFAPQLRKFSRIGNDALLPHPVDRFLFVNVWHHIEDQAGYLALMKKPSSLAARS